MLNRRIINAYNILPIYSKNSDQHGPLSGNISPLPRTSRICPGTAGIMNIAHSSANITIDVDDWLPSQRANPDSAKLTAPITAPIITMG